MGRLLQYNDQVGGTVGNADEVAFDNTGTGLSSLNVQDALAEIGGGIKIVEINIPSTGSYYNADMPSGYTTSNSVILGSMYFNTNNNLWYYNSLDSVAVCMQGSGSNSKVSVYNTIGTITKVRVILYRYA